MPPSRCHFPTTPAPNGSCCGRTRRPSMAAERTIVMSQGADGVTYANWRGTLLLTGRQLIPSGGLFKCLLYALAQQLSRCVSHQQPSPLEMADRPGADGDTPSTTGGATAWARATSADWNEDGGIPPPRVGRRGCPAATSW